MGWEIYEDFEMKPGRGCLGREGPLWGIMHRAHPLKQPLSLGELLSVDYL